MEAFRKYVEVIMIGRILEASRKYLLEVFRMQSGSITMKYIGSIMEVSYGSNMEVSWKYLKEVYRKQSGSITMKYIGSIMEAS